MISHSYSKCSDYNGPKFHEEKLQHSVPNPYSVLTNPVYTSCLYSFDLYDWVFQMLVAMECHKSTYPLSDSLYFLQRLKFPLKESSLSSVLSPLCDRFNCLRVEFLDCNAIIIVVFAASNVLKYAISRFCDLTLFLSLRQIQGFGILGLCYITMSVIKTPTRISLATKVISLVFNSWQVFHLL